MKQNKYIQSNSKAHVAFPVGTRNSILYGTDRQYVALCNALHLEPRLRTLCIVMS